MENINSRRYVANEKCIFKIGQEIGKQIIASEAYYGKNSNHLVDVKCHCGFIRPVSINALKNNKSVECKSCANKYDNTKFRKV